jgi:hypothetical protein
MRALFLPVVYVNWFAFMLDRAEKLLKFVIQYSIRVPKAFESISLLIPDKPPVRNAILLANSSKI